MSTATIASGRMAILKSLRRAWPRMIAWEPGFSTGPTTKPQELTGIEVVEFSPIGSIYRSDFAWKSERPEVYLPGR